MALLPRAIADLVARDGLARQATADDGSQHVLFLDGSVVRSILASEWQGALPPDRTEADSLAAIAQREAMALQEQEPTPAHSAQLSYRLHKAP